MIHQKSLVKVFPAWAGMILFPKDSVSIFDSIPRMSGDDPLNCLYEFYIWVYSPHERGWSRSNQNFLLKNCVFPAWAGMIPKPLNLLNQPIRIPRMSGDDPNNRIWGNQDLEYSPHERGWSLFSLISHQLFHVFPAWAGMILYRDLGKVLFSSIPRMSGDDP